MNSRPLRPERSALPSALYPVEKRQHALPFGCGRRIRTLTMRVRVAGATITQFRIKVLYYYTKNRACCQYPFERNFVGTKEILRRETLRQKSFAALRAGRGICERGLCKIGYTGPCDIGRKACEKGGGCAIMHTAQAGGSIAANRGPSAVHARPKQRRPGQNMGRIGGRPHAYQSGRF